MSTATILKKKITTDLSPHLLNMSPGWFLSEYHLLFLFFLFRCATAYVLLAEEEATTIVDAEKYFKQALKAGENVYRKSQHCGSQSPQHEAQLSK